MDPREQLQKQIDEAVHYITRRSAFTPRVGIVLGSGLQLLADEIDVVTAVDYGEIPHFPIPMAPGHGRRLLLAEMEGIKIAVMEGRFHFYEGYTMMGVTLPIRVLRTLGVDELVVTNAAGGLNESFEVGDIMIIDDQINLMGLNPLIGPHDKRLGPRFVDMSHPYDEELAAYAENTGREEGIPVQKGVYVGVPGPAYETKAEIRYIRQAGGDAVGMSTVPEVIVANQVGLKVLGLACITNVSSGLAPEHETVMRVAREAVPKVASLVKGVLRQL